MSHFGFSFRMIHLINFSIQNFIPVLQFQIPTPARMCDTPYTCSFTSLPCLLWGELFSLQMTTRMSPNAQLYESAPMGYKAALKDENGCYDYPRSRLSTSGRWRGARGMVSLIAPIIPEQRQWSYQVRMQNLAIA
jgi:hypothetical protein